MRPDAMVQQPNTARGGLTTGALLAGAVSLLALPSAVLAFTVRFDSVADRPAEEGALGNLGAVESATRLSRNFPASSLARGKLYPFTPASSPTRPDRSVTVAVRVDEAAARTLIVRAPRLGTQQVAERPEVRIAPTAFSLGVSRGYAGFAPGLVRKDDTQSPGTPDLGRYTIAGGQTASTRFNPRIVMDETKQAGRAPRTYAGDADDRVDVGGSYRLTRNLDVTAGVRYAQERERLTSPSEARQDNQAVYVGTQFRF